jgi:GTP-binding protein
MFIDETTIEVKAGDGGNGCFAYMREKFKPTGRPSGGNGGEGGSIWIEGSANLHTLQDVNYRKKYSAPRGAHGQGADKYGKGGEDVIVLVPLGTVIYDTETNQMLFDCLEQQGQRVIVAKGGRGGIGQRRAYFAKEP